ncbi:serine protease [Streptomyces cyaneofuscatus]|uniref:Serine protease n=1 Tax=Streptomyces cyaneofuscatus TaxID=66883 RepID=A0ABZ1F0X3_9ACTN|nr:serine protease [Streptomyces cyaneofuscatus]WSB10023.1 serine protease [Streptomyces cyaneofuscatus]WSD46444.1 serine protease [Streptomyces cyaneofuscatus]WTA89821.1 serine protease [Streptomyces cyaneofuscatus]
MNKPLIGAFLAALLLGTGITPAVAAEAGQARESATETAPAARAVTFAGTVALSNCSGSVVRSPDSQPTDPALVLSNGHCLETGFPGPGEVLVDRPSTRTFTLLDASGNGLGTLKASKIAYGTMTDTDLSLYELTSTYEQIESSYGIEALELETAHPVAGTAITVASGYWKRTYSCDIDGFVHQLKEGRWTWKDSVRYTPECQTIGGTSGSPVIDDTTGKVVAVNNTGNESGQECTDNNPCEVDENGEVTVREGINYAQQTYNMVPCIGTGNKIDLDREGCGLPKP